MSRAIMKFRPKVPASGIALERLEQRRVLSAAIAPGPFAAAPGGASLRDLISASPSDGAIVPESAAPSAIVVQLNPTLLQSWNKKTAALYRLGDDGTATPVFDDGQWPKIIKDPAKNTVTIPLGGALGPGRYRLSLLGGFGSFSQLISNGAWDFMEDQTLAEFEVVEQGGEFGSAVDAGTAGLVARTFAGALTSEGDQAFYKVDLGADQALWRLGLQLDAQRLGGGLLATLTVYDAGGNVVASSAGRRGLASAPDDPYLFVGLQPGTYYVGVSAAAGAGAYRLAIAADPVVGPTRVTGFALDWTRGAPTGFTITFSDAIAPDALGATGAPLWVVGTGGAIHPAALGSASDGLRRLSFVFNEPLPAGKYALVAPGEGGLVDLIGRAPLADGLPPGLLAYWTVAPYRADPGPGAPGPGASWLDGANRESLIDNAVGSGGALTLRFGVGTGTTTPSAPGPIGGSREPALGSSVGAPPGTSFVGVLDSSLFGRPVARNDGPPGMGPIPPRGHALLARVARERLAGETPAPGPADDGLARSPNGALEPVGPTPPPTAEPKLIEFPRGWRAESTAAGLRADVDALERIEANRLVDASARLIEWLFGAPVPGGRDNGPGLDSLDAQILAQIDGEEPQRAEGSLDQPSDAGATRAGLGVPTGVLILVAVAYRLRRRPPQWWRRRRPVIEPVAEPRRPPVPRGPRYMVARPERTAARSGLRGR